ncbi:methylated-DNA--[protein]-cysteine S-methyltransferase [Herbidospora mongoliensis]|uniref:methylated-DNA--[protein]-cysteine S-methyltransferase n=1 Tax=Herbidospora mongoliensis TaxID=688067 RepID=UPI000830B40B|nr:methylated-DNA--[protein]-cysteine S-methyltransferase [Herbidospora mongoliensis]
MIITQTVQTPAGPLALLAKDDVLVAAGFTGDPEAMFVRLAPELRKLGLAVGEVPGAAGAVKEYLDGRLDALDDIAAVQPGTERRQRLLTALRGVKAGTTVRYAELAERAGMPRTAARAAGGACAQNLIAPFIPCHRVLPASGGYGGYYYGTPVKEWLLAHEGASL